MWFWFVKAITGSIVGNATAEWFKKTRLGVWFYNKIDSWYNWAAVKYDIKILTEEQIKINQALNQTGYDMSANLTNIIDSKIVHHPLAIRIRLFFWTYFSRL